MAGDWIKLRSGFDTTLEFAQLLEESSVPHERLVYQLYRLASYFCLHGKYGKLRCSTAGLDLYVNAPGFAQALRDVGWLEDHDGVLTLRGFCDVSAQRKGLGRALRDELLNGKSCAACGATTDLEVDHIVPIVRGGSCERGNLQALCSTCNRAKGRKTMEEFRGARA